MTQPATKSTTRIHPGVNPACAGCGGTSIRIVANGEVAQATQCECVRGCPRCNDTKFVRERVEGVTVLRRCECTQMARLLDRFSQAAIPGRMATKEMANFDFSRVSTNVVRTVSPYLATYEPEQMNPGIIFYGDVGRGKTHLMAAMVRSLMLTHGITARFVEFSHLLADLKSNFGRGEGAAALIEPLVQVDVLAIDELGKGRNTEFEGTVLDELVSRRYNAGRTILATTNYNPGNSQGVAVPDFTSGRRPALVDRVGDRVYSRLLEMCQMVHIDGQDYRQSLADQRAQRGVGKLS